MLEPLRGLLLAVGVVVFIAPHHEPRLPHRGKSHLWGSLGGILLPHKQPRGPGRRGDTGLIQRNLANLDLDQKNQLGRRNLDPKAASILRGKLYNGKKKEVRNPEGAGGKSGKIVKGKNCPKQSTAEVVAKETGVSARTVKNDAQFAEAVEELGIDYVRHSIKRKPPEFPRAVPEMKIPNPALTGEELTSLINSTTNFLQLRERRAALLAGHFLGLLGESARGGAEPKDSL